MKNYILALLTACICLSTLKPVQAQNWMPLGPSDGDQASAGAATYTSVAVDSLGTVYAAYSDGSYGGKATVVKRSGAGHWTPVGAAGFTSGAATYTYIVIGKNATPYLVFSDGANSNKATVMSYNGTAWSAVGSAGFSAGAASYTTMDMDKAGNIYVAYADAGNSGNATVMKYNGSSWANVGSAGFSAGTVTYTSIAVNKKNGTVYVAYRDGSTTNTAATVMKYNGSSWSNVGGTGFTPAGASYTFIALDTAGTPYVIFRDANGFLTRNRASVMKYSGSWTNVGTAQFTTAAVTYCSIAFTKSDSLFASFAVGGGFGGGAGNAGVMKYNGTSWASVGAGAFTTGGTTYNQIAVSPSGSLYTIFSDGGNANKAATYTYNGSAWVLLGSTGFAKGGANYTSLSIDSKGTPYTAYSDASYTNNTTVKMWTGGYWTTLGTSGFSAGAASYVNLNISGKDSLFVIYSDGAGGGGGGGNGARATVMQYNGLGWLTVGTAGFSTGRVRYTALDFGTNDTLFAVMTERGTGGGGGGGTYYVTAYKYNGASWAQLGGNLSTGAATYTSIAVDTSGTPYIAFCDAGNSTANSVTVMKYTGGAWATVGTAGFSAGAAAYTNIAINSTTNMPYVTYSDGVNGNKATLMMYNGTSWVNVGTAGFTAGSASYTTMDFDPIDRPYVSFSDANNGGRESVMYYDGTTWASSGNADFSTGGTTYGSLVLDSLGNQFVSATEGDPYAWKHSCLLPQINMQPTNNSVCVSTATSFVVGSDVNNNTFQWQLFDGSSWNNLLDTGVYTGSLTDSLSLSSVSAGISGYKYRCIITNYCGSDTTTSATLTVVTSGAPTVTVSVSPSDTVCMGTNVTFTATPTLGGSTPTYQWKKNGTNVGTGSTYSYNGFATGDSVRCILTSSASCASVSSVSSSTVNMYVNALDTPAVVITASPDTICGTTSVTFTSTVTNNGSGNVSYQWYYNGAAVAGQTGSTLTGNLPAGGGGGAVYPMYVQITISGTKKCLASASVNSNSITVVKVASITPHITISTPKDTACKGVAVNFSSAIKNGSGFPAYQWKVNGASITGATTATLNTNTLNNFDSVSCTLTPAGFGGCTYSPTSVTSNQIKMTINPIVNPAVTFVAKQGYLVTQGKADTFVASTYCGGKGATYVWSVNNVVVSSATTNTFITSSLPVGGDLVKVVTTCNVPCGGSVTDSAVVTVATATNDIVTGASNVIVYPNPNNGQFSIKADISHSTAAQCQVEVINALGQVVRTQNDPVGNGHLDTKVNMNNCSAGLYLVRVKSGNEVLFTARINVQ